MPRLADDSLAPSFVPSDPSTSTSMLSISSDSYIFHHLVVFPNRIASKTFVFGRPQKVSLPTVLIPFPRRRGARARGCLFFLKRVGGAHPAVSMARVRSGRATVLRCTSKLESDNLRAEPSYFPSLLSITRAQCFGCLPLFARLQKNRREHKSIFITNNDWRE